MRWAMGWAAIWPDARHDNVHKTALGEFFSFSSLSAWTNVVGNHTRDPLSPI